MPLISEGLNTTSIQLDVLAVAPDTPPSGYSSFYIKSDGPYYLDDAGVEHLINFDSLFADGDATSPSISFIGDTNTGLFHIDPDILGITTGGVERFRFTNTQVVFNENGLGTFDFRAEGDTDINLLFVDVSADLIGIGTSSPSAKLHVRGTTDDQQLIVQSNASQTADIMQVLNNAGSPLIYVDPNGFLGLNTDPSYRLDVARSATLTSGTDIAVRSTITATPSAASSASFTAVRGDVSSATANNITGSLRGFNSSIVHSGNATISNVWAGYNTITNSGAGIISSAVGYLTQVVNSGGGSITSGFGFYVLSPSGTVNTPYGLFIANQTSGFAILTNDGLVVFNEGGTATADVRIEGDTDVNLFFTDASVDAVGIGVNNPLAKLHIDQSNSGANIPVIILDQADVDKEFIHLIGTSAGGVSTNNLVAVADLAGSIVAYARVQVQDNNAGTLSGTYYIPLYQ